MMNLRSNLALARVVLQGGFYTGVILREGAALCAAKLVEEHARRTPQHTAVLFEERRYSYAALNAAANRVASALQELGVRKGDCIALLMDNRPEYLFTILGANKLGVVTSLINSHVAGAQLVHALKICNPRLVIVGDEHLANLAEIQADLPVAAHDVLVWSESTQAAAPKDARDMNALFVASRESNPKTTHDQKTDDPMLYMYTSGTTGLPKAAIVKNQRFLRAGLIFGRVVLGLTDKDVNYLALPLYHATGAIAAWGSTLCTGGTIVIRRKFSASTFWDDCVRYGVTWFPYIGEVCRYLLQAPRNPNEQKHRVRVVLGAGMRPDVWRPFVQRFGIGRVIEFYGSTEGNVAMVNFEGKEGMMGRLLPGQAVVRVDAETEEFVRKADGTMIKAQPGEQGILVGRIDKINKFDGYLDKKKTSEKILVNPFGDGRNYFDSGDLVNVHEGGYVSFADRLGDTFRWKGENVATTEVSVALNQCPGVVESNVYGVEVPGAEGRAGMVALVVDDSFDLEHFAQHVLSGLPRYARPYFVRLQTQLAVTGSFKYVKTHLKKEGFDPSKVSDPLYLLDLEQKTYVRLDGTLFQKLAARELSL
jgi:acyl-CoA synthetase (AMP-forming)/AMP-acid ligase II